MTWTRSSDERGAVLLWFGLMMVVLLAIAALAVDLGYAYGVKRQLSSTADASALAGAQEAGRKFKAAGGCNDDLRGYVETAAKATYAANGPWGGADAPTIRTECFGPDEVTPASGLNATSVVVKVDTTSTLNTFFGRAIGVETLKPTGTATARVVGGTALDKLRPFLVCLDDARFARDNPDTTLQSYYAKPGGSVAPTSLTLLEGDRPWDAGTDEITTASNHRLSTNDYVYLATADTNAADGYYYVIKTGNRSLKVSQTRDGAAFDLTTTGTVDIYRLPASVSGTWATTGVVTASSHGFNTGDYTRVSITSGAAGASDGYFFVTKLTDDTFTLTRPEDTTPFKPTAAGVVNVYKLPAPGTSSTGCMPGSSPANWGYSAFDFSNSDATQLLCLIESGYGGGSACPDSPPPGVELGSESNAIPSEGDNGNNLQTSAGALIDTLVDEVILLPVGSTWNTLGGNNAQYTGHGALAVTLCGAWIPKNNIDGSYARAKWRSAKGACWDQGLADNPRNLAGGGTPVDILDTSLVIQWRYEDEWVETYIGQTTESQCQLGSATCIPVLQLIE